MKASIQVVAAVMICQAVVMRKLIVGAFGSTSCSHSSSIMHRRALSSRTGRTTFLFRKGKSVSESRSTTTTMNSSTEENSDTKKDHTEYSNKNNIDDQAVSAISGCGGVKVTCATIRNMVNDAMIMHTMSAVPADALARSMTCSLLMSNGMPDEHTVQITLNGDGPLRGVVSICNGKGEIKAYVGNPGINGFTLPDAVGKGTVQVVKNHPSWPNPYNGITAIRNGDIDQDVGVYLAESEQRSCALAAAASINGILCTSAGGYLVEQLPGCGEETISRVEQNLRMMVEKGGSDDLPTNLLLNGYAPLDIVDIILDGLDMQPLQQIRPSLTCDCGEDRLIRALRLLPKEEVDTLIEEQQQIEARCEFCGKVYRMSPDEVEAKMEEATGDPARDDP